MTIRAGLLALAMAGMITSGCATTGDSLMTSNTAPLPPLAQSATIEVENNNWSDMVVYAVHHNRRVRLGMVSSMNRRVFDLPSTALFSVSDLRLLAAPIGSSAEYLTDPIHVDGGQRVEFRIENVMSISNWAVW